MKKTLRWTGIALVVVFAAIQAIRPAKTNPPIDQSKTIENNTQMSPEVVAVLDRACADCHSSKTTWPWYSQIAPISWYLADHVKDGRKELSLSDWGTYETRRKSRKLDEIREQVESGTMPIKSYVLLHPNAKLSDADRRLLIDWANQERERMLTPPPTN